MSDYISRQAVIDALHTWFRDGFDEDKWWNSTHVLAAIESLPSAQPEQRWIPCSERLPKEKDAGILKKLGIKNCQSMSLPQ